jgi:hypothetical protein
MRCILAVGLVMAITSLGAATDEKYTSKDGKFAVAFPKGAKVKTDEKQIGELTMKLTMKLTMIDSDGVLYGVVYIDVAKDETGKGAKVLFDAIEQGLVRSSGAKVTSSKEIEFGPDKYPGRDVLSEKDGQIGRLRVVFAGERVYVVMLRGPDDFAKSKAGSAFIDSFEITK